MSNVSMDMLTAAMKKAVELGIFPQYAIDEQYLKNWSNMREVLAAALEMQDVKTTIVTRKVERCTYCHEGAIECDHCIESGGWPSGLQVCDQCGGDEEITCKHCDGKRTETCRQCDGKKIIGCGVCRGRGFVDYEGGK